MSIPAPLNLAALLAIALVSVACAADSEPAAEVVQPTAAAVSLSTNDATATEAPPNTLTPAPSPTPQPALDLLNLGPAPEIANQVWLNTDRPLDLVSLKGEVVLVEFWTFG